MLGEPPKDAAPPSGRLRAMQDVAVHLKTPRHTSYCCPFTPHALCHFRYLNVDLHHEISFRKNSEPSQEGGSDPQNLTCYDRKSRGKAADEMAYNLIEGKYRDITLVFRCMLNCKKWRCLTQLLA